MATEKQTTNDDDEPASKQVELSVGCYVEMRGGNWFPCSDVNRRLSRDGITAIATVLEPIWVDAADGGQPTDVRTFTLRQFYQSGRPTLDYTPATREAHLAGWAKYLNPQRRRDIETVLMKACKEFEKKYKGYEADVERLFGAPV